MNILNLTDEEILQIAIGKSYLLGKEKYSPRFDLLGTQYIHSNDTELWEDCREDILTFAKLIIALNAQKRN
jgi:hypothetical protein